MQFQVLGTIVLDRNIQQNRDLERFFSLLSLHCKIFQRLNKITASFVVCKQELMGKSHKMDYTDFFIKTKKYNTNILISWKRPTYFPRSRSSTENLHAPGIKQLLFKHCDSDDPIFNVLHPTSCNLCSQITEVFSI